jgi:hypothetical protein
MQRNMQRATVLGCILAVMHRDQVAPFGQAVRSRCSLARAAALPHLGKRCMGRESRLTACMVSRACLSRIAGCPLPSWCVATHAMLYRVCCRLHAVTTAWRCGVSAVSTRSAFGPVVQCNAVSSALCGCQVFGSVVIVTFAPSSDVELTMELLLS